MKEELPGSALSNDRVMRSSSTRRTARFEPYSRPSTEWSSFGSGADTVTQPAPSTSATVFYDEINPTKRKSRMQPAGGRTSKHGLADSTVRELPEMELAKRQSTGAPTFAFYLLQLLIDPSKKEIIAWSGQGREFRIKDENRLIEIWSESQGRMTLISKDALRRNLRANYHKGIWLAVNAIQLHYAWTTEPSIHVDMTLIQLDDYINQHSDGYSFVSAASVPSTRKSGLVEPPRSQSATVPELPTVSPLGTVEPGPAQQPYQVDFNGYFWEYIEPMQQLQQHPGGREEQRELNGEISPYNVPSASSIDNAARHPGEREEERGQNGGMSPYSTHSASIDYAIPSIGSVDDEASSGFGSATVPSDTVYPNGLTAMTPVSFPPSSLPQPYYTAYVPTQFYTVPNSFEGVPMLPFWFPPNTSQPSTSDDYTNLANL